MIKNIFLPIAILSALGGLALVLYFIDQSVQKFRRVEPFNGEIPSGPIWRIAQVVGVITFLYVAAKYGGDYDPEYHRP